MKVFKQIYSLLCIFLITLCSACSENPVAENKPSFVGIAIFQNSKENTKWSTIRENKTLINNIIETKDNKIVYNDDPEFLFYIYCQDEITSKTKDNEYISNTVKDNVIISENKLSFTFERIAEETDIFIYFVYKIDGNYYLEFIKEYDAISKESETITLGIENNYFNKVELNLKINLSIKKEY